MKDMKNPNELLRKAYEETADLIDRDLKILPKSMEKVWEKLVRGFNTIQFLAENGYYPSLDEYAVFREASAEFGRPHIGPDNCFSSVIDACGLRAGSQDWYRVMAYHYLSQANEIERRWEMRDEY